MAESAFYDPSAGTAFYDPTKTAGDQTLAQAAASVPAPLTTESDKKVNVVDKDGKTYALPESQLGQAASQGFRLETSEEAGLRSYLDENKGFSGDAQVASRSFLKELSFGLFDPADVWSDPYEKAREDALEEHHKIASGIGSAGGFAAGLVGGEGIFSAVGKAGEATRLAVLGAEAGEKVVAEKLGAEIAARVLEGGGTEAAASAAKEAAPGLLRQLVAHGAGGAVEGALLSAPSALHERIFGDPERAAETLLYGMGGGALLGVGGLIGSKIKNAGAEALSRTLEASNGGLKEWLDRQSGEQTFRSLNGIKKQTTEAIELEGGTAGVGKAVQEEVGHKKLGESMADYADRVNEGRARVGEEKLAGTYKRLDELAPDTGYKTADLTNKMRTEIIDPLRSKLGYDPVVKELEGKLNEIETKYGPNLSFSQMHELKQGIADRVNWTTVEPSLATKVKRQFYGVLDKSIYQAADSVSPKLAGELKQANMLYRKMRLASKAAEQGAAKELTNRALSLSDHLAGLGAMGTALAHPVGALMGVGGALANKFARTEGNALAARTFGSLANGEGLMGIEKAFALAGDKFAKIPQIFDRMSMVGGNRVARETLADKLGKGKSYEDMAQHLAELSSNPQRMADLTHEMTAPFAKDAPNISTALASKTGAVLSYLANAAPKKPSVSNPFTPQVKWRPSDQQLSDFARKVQIVQDPFKALDYLEDGSLNAADVDALKTVYPKLYSEMVNRMMDHGASGTAQPLPYDKRVKLSILTGAPVDASMGNLAKYQSVFTEAPAKAAPMGKAISAPNLATDVDQVTISGASAHQMKG